MNAHQVSRVSLKPVDVDAIVFWSKNPRPIMSHLDELDQMGFRYYFQFTLNDYPTALEPNVPDLGQRLSAFLDLSTSLGPSRVIWRYDPIIISNVTDVDFHRDRFAGLASSLSGATERAMVSLCDYYKKTDRRLGALEAEGYRFDRDAASSPSVAALLKGMATEAAAHSIEVFTCAEDVDFSDLGVKPGRCVDADLIKRIWGVSACADKDAGQREHCRCVVSKDIGINDTCLHGCQYCYSTRNSSLAERRSIDHDPGSPTIWHHSKPEDNADNRGDRQMPLFT